MLGEPSVPVKIGRFEILERVGAGAMGIVFAALDRRLDRKVAIKLLRDEDRDVRTRTRLEGEAKALAKLSHPHVVGVFEVGEHEDRLFIAMEYVRGRTLRKWAAERVRGWQAIVAMYAQAGRGLAAAHAQGIVHRDFKPENVLVGDDERARVLDFGLARTAVPIELAESVAHTRADDHELRSTLTRTGASVGTPAYMAPEQFSRASVDALADQFSFCVSLWEGLYGERPFAGDTLHALIEHVQAGRCREPPDASATPQWIRRVIERGLAPSPTERWPSMPELLHALERDPTRRRRQWLLGVAAAVAIAGIAAATTAVLVLRSRVSSEPATVADAAATTTPRAPPTPRQLTRLDGAQIASPAVSSDGSSVACLVEAGTKRWLEIAPTRGGPGVRHPLDGPVLESLAFDASGDPLAVLGPALDDLGLTAFPAGGGAPRRLRNVPLSPESVFEAIAIAPDGLAMAAVDTATNRIVRVDDAGRITAVGRTRGDVHQLAWSPDRRRIAWIEGGALGGALMIASSDGDRQHEAASTGELVSTVCAGLTFIGDDRLVFAHQRVVDGLGVAELWEQRLDGDRFQLTGERERVMEVAPGHVCGVAASADGRVVAFLRREVHDAIRVAELEGPHRLGEARPMTSETRTELLVGWTPDSRGVVFLSQRDGEPTYYIRELGSEDAIPVFRPDNGDGMLLGQIRDQLVFAPTPDNESTSTAAVGVAVDRTPRAFGSFRELQRSPWSSCGGDRCAQLVADGDGLAVRELVWSDAQARELARIPIDERENLVWVLAPDGRRAALLPRGDTLYIVSLVGDPLRRITIPAAEGVGPPTLQYAGWFPDGSALLVSGMGIDGHQYALARVELDGAYRVVHTETDRWMSSPTVAPDGRHVAFGSRNVDANVWVIER